MNHSRFGRLLLAFVITGLTVSNDVRSLAQEAETEVQTQQETQPNLADQQRLELQILQKLAELEKAIKAEREASPEQQANSQQLQRLQQQANGQAIQQQEKDRQAELRLYQEQQKARHNQMMMLQRKLELQKTRLVERELEYRELAEKSAEQSFIPKEEVRKQIGELLKQRTELNIQLAGLKSAEKHMQEMQQESLAKRQAAYNREIEIAARIRDSQQSKMARTKELVDRGAGSTEMLIDAETQVLQATAELERLKRESEDDSAAPFTEAVFENSIELARISAKIQALEVELAQLKERQQTYNSLVEVRSAAIQQYLERAYQERLEFEDHLQSDMVELNSLEKHVLDLERRLREEKKAEAKK